RCVDGGSAGPDTGRARFSRAVNSAAGMVRILLMLLRGVVGAALLTLVLSYCGAGRVLALVGQLHLGWLLVGNALAIGHAFIVARRWRLVCGALTGVAPHFRRPLPPSAPRP